MDEILLSPADFLFLLYLVDVATILGLTKFFCEIESVSLLGKKRCTSILVLLVFFRGVKGITARLRKVFHVIMLQMDNTFILDPKKRFLLRVLKL